jgi:predicted TIM-barrel fold metal-dependent hydrolase
MDLSRRSFIRVAGVNTLSAGGIRGQTAQKRTLVIDTHAHLFSTDEKRYPPRGTPARPPGDAGTIERLRREVEANHVRAVCGVQVSGFYGFDNRFICDAAKANPGWMAGVCTLDPDDPHSPELLARYKKEYGIRGMRSVAARGGKLDHPSVRALWKSALEHGIVVNLLTRSGLADEADRLLQDFPELPVVLDHSLQLEAGPRVSETLTALRKLSKHKNVYAKVSFIGNGPQGCLDGFPCRSFHEVCLEVIHIFGAERCAWGSHYPQETYSPKLTYSQTLRIFSEVLPLSDEERVAVLGGTARKLWFPEW